MSHKVWYMQTGPAQNSQPYPSLSPHQAIVPNFLTRPNIRTIQLPIDKVFLDLVILSHIYHQLVLSPHIVSKCVQSPPLYIGTYKTFSLGSDLLHSAPCI